MTPTILKFHQLLWGFAKGAPVFSISKTTQLYPYSGTHMVQCIRYSNGFEQLFYIDIFSKDFLSIRIPFSIRENAYKAIELIESSLGKEGMIDLTQLQTASEPNITSLTECANNGDMKAQYYLGLHYLEGEHIQKDEIQGANLIRSAAQAGFKDAEYTLGVLLQQGIGINKDCEQARLWYEKAIAQKEPRAMLNLANLNEDSHTSSADFTIQRLQLTKKAARLGLLEAQVNLALFYLFGLSSARKDYDLAYPLLFDAAQQLFPLGIYWLGVCYAYGLGMHLNIEIAEQIWRVGMLSSSKFPQYLKSNICGFNNQDVDIAKAKVMRLSYEDLISIEWSNIREFFHHLITLKQYD